MIVRDLLVVVLPFAISLSPILSPYATAAISVSAAQTASPTSLVVADGPVGFRSSVTRPLFNTCSIARFTALASSTKPKLYSSIGATDPIAPKGFALFCPAISGADPCTGSYRPTQTPLGRWLPIE